MKVYNWFSCLVLFPTVTTQNTRNITCHGFICGPYLLKIVGTLVSFAFATRKRIGCCRHVDFKFVLVPFALGFDQCRPPFWRKFLVCHECNLLRFDCFIFDLL